MPSEREVEAAEDAFDRAWLAAREKGLRISKRDRITAALSAAEAVRGEEEGSAFDARTEAQGIVHRLWGRPSDPDEETEIRGVRDELARALRAAYVAGQSHGAIGYAVESKFEPGSVQIWPEAALERKLERKEEPK